MHRRIATTAFALALAFTPIVASAQDVGSVTSLVSSLINYAIGTLVGVAILAFFVGLVRYLFKSGSSEDKGKGIKLMIYGIVTIAVMLSVYGLVRFLQNSLGLRNDPITPIQYQQVQVTQQP